MSSGSAADMDYGDFKRVYCPFLIWYLKTYCKFRLTPELTILFPDHTDKRKPTRGSSGGKNIGAATGGSSPYTIQMSKSKD